MSDPYQLVFACERSWDDMSQESETARHCEVCQHAVHDLSAMTEREARALILDAQARGERLCGIMWLDEAERPIFAPEPPPTRGPIHTLKALLAAAALPAVLAACEQPTKNETTPSAQAPIVVQDGQPPRLDPAAPGGGRAPEAPPAKDDDPRAEYRATLERLRAQKKLADERAAARAAEVNSVHKIEPRSGSPRGPGLFFVPGE